MTRSLPPTQTGSSCSRTVNWPADLKLPPKPVCSQLLQGSVISVATTLGTVAFSHLGKHRLRFALTSIGIAISAFSLTAVLLINTSFYDEVRQAAGQKYSTADAVVETTDRFTQGDATDYLLTQEQADRVENLPAVESAWMLATTYAIIHIPAEGEQAGSTYSIVQADMPAPTPPRPWPTATSPNRGRPPR